KYALNKIKEDLYNKLIDNYELELNDLKASKSELGDYQKDLDKFVSFGLSFLSNLDKYYRIADVNTKVRILGSIFSEKLHFFESSFRTLPYTDAVALICNYNKGLHSFENKKGETYKNLSHFVPWVGIEPTLRRTRV